jgi:hypothetical protein
MLMWIQRIGRHMELPYVLVSPPLYLAQRYDQRKRFSSRLNNLPRGLKIHGELGILNGARVALRH